MYLWMIIIVTEYIYMKNHQLYLSIFGYCCHLSTIFWEWQSCWDGLTLKYKNMVYVLCTLQLQLSICIFEMFFLNLKIYFPSVHHYKKINNYTVYILMNSNFLLTFKQNVCLKSSSIFKCLLKIKHTWLYLVFWYLFKKNTPK